MKKNTERKGARVPTWACDREAALQEELLSPPNIRMGGKGSSGIVVPTYGPIGKQKKQGRGQCKAEWLDKLELANRA